MLNGKGFGGIINREPMNIEPEAKQRQAQRRKKKISKESTSKGLGSGLPLGGAVGYTRYFILK